ncbi:hypothetical protein MFIFM68171_07989 [Madurella fahalii]|uniref:F-box domain-containing protein n=1 Tax=Madurella fahalii TaxID=1157608 RepID=A0ABQ0GJ34_9PEZI
MEPPNKKAKYCKSLEDEETVQHIICPPALNYIPKEIAAMIFEKLDSPEDLLAMITTYRSLFEAFLAVKKPILRAVAENTFGTNFVDLVQCEKAPRMPFLPRGLYSNPAVMVVDETQQEYLKSLFNVDEDDKRYALPSDLPSLIRQYQPLKRINKLVDQYMQHHFHSLATGTEPGQSRPDPPQISGGGFTSDGKAAQFRPLAMAERNRIRRGFIRFETLCQMTFHSRWRAALGRLEYGYIVDARQLVFVALAFTEGFFFEHAPIPWQGAAIEEILCVASFVQTQHKLMLAELHNDVASHSDQHSNQILIALDTDRENHGAASAVEPLDDILFRSGQHLSEAQRAAFRIRHCEGASPGLHAVVESWRLGPPGKYNCLALLDFGWAFWDRDRALALDSRYQQPSNSPFLSGLPDFFFSYVIEILGSGGDSPTGEQLANFMSCLQRFNVATSRLKLEIARLHERLDVLSGVIGFMFTGDPNDQ